MLPTHDVSRLLRQCAFFAATDDDALAALAGHTTPLRLHAGECLFEKGTAGDAMYLVVDGRVRVHNGDEVVVRLGAGEVFGEIGALSSEPRTASVTAEQDSALLALDQASIFATLAARPDASRAVIQALCRRESQIIDEKFERIVRAKVLENELEIGQRIQKSFLPDAIPAVPGWRLDGLLRPARKVSGDFYDFFLVPALGALGLVIGDVCDKGVGAALFMSLFRSLIRSAALGEGALAAVDGGADRVVRHAIASTNRYIAATHSGSSMFASVFLGLLDTASGRLSYTNAGHEAPCIVAADGTRRELPTNGPVVGLFEEAAFGLGHAELAPGEMLFAYTDGASDALDAAGQPFTEARLLDAARAAARAAAAGSAGLLRGIDAQLQQFVGSADQYDDVTMIGVYRESTL
jgi:phosphoserine phosphatase RsbU/P